jgi:hypothetical protein
MIVGIGTETAQFLFWENINWIFGTVLLIVSMQDKVQPTIENSDFSLSPKRATQLHIFAVDSNTILQG